MSERHTPTKTEFLKEFSDQLYQDAMNDIVSLVEEGNFDDLRELAGRSEEQVLTEAIEQVKSGDWQFTSGSGRVWNESSSIVAASIISITKLNLARNLVFVVGELDRNISWGDISSKIKTYLVENKQPSLPKPNNE